MKNIKEARSLIKRYETITLEEIHGAFVSEKNTYIAKKLLTGFGSLGTCTLCIRVSSLCYDCIYEREKACMYGNNEKTYNAIENAKTPEELLEAYRNRAKHIINIL